MVHETMNRQLAEKIYLFILKRINGWTDEELAELHPEEIYCDPLFEDLCSIEVEE
jgi:hypothetical protein